MAPNSRLSDAGLAGGVSITGALHRAATRLRKPGGRPRTRESEKVARREATRAYRARLKGASAAP